MNNVSEVAFSLNGSLLFVHYISNRGQLIAKNNEVIKNFDYVSEVILSPDGSLLFIHYRDNDGTYKGELIDAKNGKVIKDDFDNVSGVTFSPNDSLLLVRYRYEYGRNQELINIKNNKIIIIRGVLEYTDRVEFSPDSSLLFVYSCYKGGKLINTKNGKVIKNNVIIDVNFSLDSSLILSVRRWSDRRVELINAKSKGTTKTFDNLHKVNFAPDNSSLFIAYRGDRKRELFTVGSFEQVLFKLALRNMLKVYEDQKNIIKGTIRRLMRKAVPAEQIKHNFATLLKHPILDTFPPYPQEKITKKITNALRDMGVKKNLLPPKGYSPPRGLTDALSNNAKRILNKGIITKRISV